MAWSTGCADNAHADIGAVVLAKFIDERRQASDRLLTAAPSDRKLRTRSALKQDLVRMIQGLFHHVVSWIFLRNSIRYCLKS